MAVELYEDDVWWKGMVLRKSPAGVFVYLPGESHPYVISYVIISHSLLITQRSSSPV
jgi:hypothetical protein